MSPHALPVSDLDGLHSVPTTSNGTRHPAPTGDTTRLHRCNGSDVHDLICVGFGPASLAIAVALQDALEHNSSALRTSTPKVRFLEKQTSFAWHAGMLLPGAKMQISFIKDLATLRNPRSHFTFLNYLHTQGRLVQFTNLGTFLPQRIEYDDYMRWCAAHFDNVVDYGQEVLSVSASEVDESACAIKHFNVVTRDVESNNLSTLRAKNVVVSVGGRPRIPTGFPQQHPRVIHSSRFATSVDSVISNHSPPRSIAVIGGGQSAAEVFDNLSSRFPHAKSYLLIKGAALRPSDDSPFVNEIFNPSRIDDVYSQQPDVRSQEITRDAATNYSVVRLELLEHIYSRLYSYRVQYGDDETAWPQQILTHRTVTGMEDCTLDGRPAITLKIHNDSSRYCAAKTPSHEQLAVDLVILATGYRRDTHEDMLADLRHLMPGGDKEGKRWTVQRDYSVEFKPGKVQPGVGVWLQGCNEQTHGLADTLLSILAVRGGEVVHSIFGAPTKTANGHVQQA